MVWPNFLTSTGTFVVISDRNWNATTPCRNFYSNESYSEADEALKGDQTLIRKPYHERAITQHPSPGSTTGNCRWEVIRHFSQATKQRPDDSLTAAVGRSL